MGKKYMKPAISFQKLSMGSNASTACTMELSFAEFTCPVLIPEWGETIFANMNDCDWTNDDINICYHVPMAGANVFSS